MFPFDLLHSARSRPALTTLFVEALAVTLVSIAMAWLVFSAASGLIAVFLVSIGMQETFLRLLEVNRRDIYEERLDPTAANAWLVAALVVVFAGCFTAFSIVAWSLPSGGLRTLFAAQLELSPLKALDLSRLSMGHFGELFARNTTVFFVCLLLSSVFRTGGAMLILAWNSSVWALSYTFLSRTTIVLGAASTPTTLMAVVGGITPHLVLEAAAYTTAALVGIFAAKAVEKYHWRSPTFRRVMTAVVLLVAIGVLMLAVGAAAESWWPQRWFALVLGA
jgi:hypothetical protein